MSGLRAVEAVCCRRVKPHIVFINYLGSYRLPLGEELQIVFIPLHCVCTRVTLYDFNDIKRDRRAVQPAEIGTRTTHKAMPVPEGPNRLLFLIRLPANAHCGVVAGVGPRIWGHWMSSGLLASAWPTSGYFRHLESEISSSKTHSSFFLSSLFLFPLSPIFK